MNKRRIAAAVIVAVLALAALGAWSWWKDFTAFDSARWKAARTTACDPEGDGVRHRMVGDLRDDHLHAGMERVEVLALLGRPDQRYGSRMEWATLSGFTRCWYFTVIFSNGRLTDTEHSM